MMPPLRYSINSILRRPKTTASVLIGIVLFVFVISMVQMLREGVQRTAVRLQDTSTLLVISNGASNEMSSFLTQRQIDRLLGLPAARGSTVIREFVILKLLETANRQSAGNVLIRGVEPGAFTFRQGLRLVAGRAPRPGSREIVAGRLASTRFADLKIGDEIELANDGKVRVVGVFAYANSSFESEIWGDLDVIRGLYGREAVVSSLRIRPRGPVEMSALVAQARKSGLPVQVLPEAQFARQQAAAPRQFIAVVGAVIAFFIGSASVIAVATVLQTAVDDRRGEVVLLRKIGFSSTVVMASCLREAVLLGLAGGVVGVALSLLLSGMKTTIMSVTTWSQLIVGFELTPGIALVSIFAGVLAAGLGSVLPAFHTARMFKLSRRPA